MRLRKVLEQREGFPPPHLFTAPLSATSYLPPPAPLRDREGVAQKNQDKPPIGDAHRLRTSLGSHLAFTPSLVTSRI